MAMRPTCDVFRTAFEVKKYAITVYELDGNGEVVQPGVLVDDIDLCPAGLKRLLTKIETGTTPPKKRKREDHGS